MRKKTISLSERRLIFVIGGQLFDQAPNRQPRKADIIMNKVRDGFRKDAHNDNEYYSLLILEDGLKTYIHDLLFTIPEFKELNLSHIEFEMGVSVDDENRPKFSFSSAYDKISADSWKSDFIDLDAFTRNVINNLFMIMEDWTDCFCCVNNNSEGLDKCVTCRVNPGFTINYECGREPKGKYTFACKYDCYKNLYICCEECDEKEYCTKKCDSNSESCGLAINRISGVKEELI